MLKQKSLLLFSLFITTAIANAVPVQGVNATNTPAALESVAEFSCASDRDCNFNGRCDVETGNCYCQSGYGEADCSYKEKKQLAAFLLHFFLGLEFGVGHFYAGNDGMGAGELVLFWGSALLTGCGVRSKVSTWATVVGSLGFLGSIGWWIADTVRFGQNKIDDGDGHKLESW
ncbi:MAG: hypothetical protein O2897_04800 [bacterium]|nr:hypothetical protein [bacterium]